jgi:hypothetical protein
MELTAYVWRLYCDSEAGKRALARDMPSHFRHVETTVFEEASEEVEQRLTDLTSKEGFCQMIQEALSAGEILSLQDAQQSFEGLVDTGMTYESDETGAWVPFIFGGGSEDPAGYVQIYDFIEAVSCGLHAAHPQFFAPYLYRTEFDRFSAICDAFGIVLPEVPGKLQKRERALYYWQINEALQRFRAAHSMTPEELNAFLYDFAPQAILKRFAEEPLPAPSRVWFVIAGVSGKGDFDYLDAATDASVSYWQGSLETRRGDLVLIWCASPRSYLHSVWRALSDGFVDPFFHFYSEIRVGHPARMPPLSFAEIAAHPVLGAMPAVRAHFQGTSGTASSVGNHEALREMANRKAGRDLKLPDPPQVHEHPALQLQSERDVETGLLEPLLARLGFGPTDWIRQFRIRLGRREKIIPDYVLGGDERPGEQTAVAIIECKLDIETSKQLNTDFGQARSYANALSCDVLVLAARRGIWVFRRRQEGFSKENFEFKTWNELAHPDALHGIAMVIGKGAIDSAVARREKTKRKASGVA